MANSGWFDYVNSLGIVGALLIGAYQTGRSAKESRERDEDRRTERSLDLYRDRVVEGDTAKAFHRLSVHLRHLGSEKYGFTTWVRLSDIDFQTGGILDPNKTGADVPFEDLYRVLWFFERVEIALDRKIVKPDVLMQTIGFHCWWWNELLAHIEAPKATAALRSIGPTAREWAANTRQLDDWVSRCKTDFNGGGPILKTHQELAKTLMAEPI